MKAPPHQRKSREQAAPPNGKDEKATQPNKEGSTTPEKHGTTQKEEGRTTTLLQFDTLLLFSNVVSCNLV